MTDNTQELDEITSNLWVRYGRPGTMDEFVPEANKVLLDWHNKQTLELLDRLEKQAKSLIRNPDGSSIGAEYIPLSAIEAERNKLKEEYNGKKEGEGSPGRAG